MKKDEVYNLLEAKMVSYSELARVKSVPFQEELVEVRPSRRMHCRQFFKEMEEFTGEAIYVRQSVANKLKRVIETLPKGLSLELLSGYRSPVIQQKLFQREKSKFKQAASKQELLESIHRRIAIPSVAGHPCGAAVDVQLLRDATPLDMGTKVGEFVKDSYTFSPYIKRSAQKNRQLLRRAMLRAGFAPFDGEWWHYSYGDREWAKFYAQPHAIYEQIDFRTG